MVLVQEHATMILQPGGDCWLCGNPTIDFKETNGRWVHFGCDKRYEEHWIISISKGDDDEGEE